MDEYYQFRSPLSPLFESTARPKVRRSQLEIRMDILKVIQAGIDAPTQIMYKANLSWVVLQEHLQSLIQNGFLRENNYGNRKKYEITEKAIAIISHFDKVAEAILSNPSKRI
ncbi:MAG: winged helix-turn-helix domain-containing protein [Nitrososphaerota archaeon]